MANSPKFSRGARIYPNLAALDETMPHGHHWGMHRVGMGWCSKEERVAEPVTVLRVLHGGSNGLKEPKYELKFSDGRRTQYDREWVEKHFRSEAGQVLFLMGKAIGDGPEAITARNALMDIGDALVREVASSFEDLNQLLDAWKNHGYRPTLRGPDRAALADIYDFAQKMRGQNAVAYRG